MRHHFRKVVLPLAAMVAASTGACDFSVIPDGTDSSVHPLDTHSLLPEYGPNTGQLASGPAGSEALEQPIAFTHHRHVVLLGMDCQYCHTEARRSIHGGVPPVETCMGCHKHVLTEKPEIQKIAGYWERQEPIPWQKVHDLPDYVVFNHARHVGAGVDCTECHGGIALQGQWPDNDPAQAAVMKREPSMQMGWCLNCHGTHPSIDTNYGDDADLRRAELKDCWTCHK